MKISIIVLTLNEIEGMKVIMPRIKKEWYDELIIADGGSTDGTVQYAFANDYKIFIQKEKGTNGAFKEAMERITGDAVILFCPDGNSIPEDIPKLIKKMEEENYDMVMASRYLPPAYSDDDDFITSIGNWCFTKLARIMFRYPFTDYLGIYRIFKADMLKKLDINMKNCSWGTSMIIQAVKKKMKISEIPSSEPKRIGGVRKMIPLINGYIEISNMVKEFFKK